MIWWGKRKNTHTTVNDKRKTEEGLALFIKVLFIKPFKMIINHFFYFASSLTAQFHFLLSAWHKKYQTEKLGVENS